MMTAEELRFKIDKNGYTKKEWVKVRDRNEALDCRIYARAVASICGIDRMKDMQLKAAGAKATLVTKLQNVINPPKKSVEQPVEKAQPQAPAPQNKPKIKRKESSYF